MVQTIAGNGPVPPQAVGHSRVDDLFRSAIAGDSPDAGARSRVEEVDESVGMLDWSRAAIGRKHFFCSTLEGALPHLFRSAAIGNIVNGLAVARPVRRRFVALRFEQDLRGAAYGRDRVQMCIARSRRYKQNQASIGRPVRLLQPRALKPGQPNRF
jgi:hypothetical protein